MRTPWGKVGRISSRASLIRPTTSRAFSPCSIITIPMTVSPLPSLVAPPMRSIGPSRTSARCRSRMGVPSPVVPTTIFSRSPAPVTRPSPRMT
jgi:hypothetical protein